MAKKQGAVDAYKLLNMQGQGVIRVAVIAVSLSCLVVFDISVGANLLDTKSLLLPFLLLSAPALLLTRKIGVGVIAVLRSQMVPIGIITSVMNLLALLVNMTDPQQVASYLKFTYAPLSFGILLSYLLHTLSVEDIQWPDLNRPESLLIAGASIIAVVGSWFLVSDSMTIGAVVDAWALAITFLVLMNGHFYHGFKSLSSARKVCHSSVFCCIVSAVLGIAYYAFAAGTNDPKLLGPTIAISLLAMFYGITICYAATLFGGKSEFTAKEGSYMDWHTIESYVFLTLMIFPPLSLIEVTTA